MRLVCLLLLGAVACSAPTGKQVAPSTSPRPSAPTATPQEAPVAAEKNPPGDIPDSTQFIVYSSAAGAYRLRVPEGWARTENGSSVRFNDKLNSISVAIEQADAPRTADTVRSIDEPKLRSAVRAFEEVKVEPSALPGGQAVLLRYRANSEPDSVTAKSTRLEIDRFEIFSNGRLAMLDLSSPAGADNVDDWRLISRSFGWQS